MDINEILGFRTVGIDTEWYWPLESTFVRYAGRDFELLPGSDTVRPMIRFRSKQGQDMVDGDHALLRLLSAISWDQQVGYSDALACWATGPMNIGRGQGGVIGSLKTEELAKGNDHRQRLALALYREGLVVNLVQYKIVAFFKIINMLHNRGEDQVQWIRENLDAIEGRSAKSRLSELSASVKDVSKYLYGECRCAIAHAFNMDQVVDPDDPASFARLHLDLPLIQSLAFRAMTHEIGIPKPYRVSAR